MRLRIADIVVGIEGLSAGLAEDARRRYAPFVDDGPAEWALEVRADDAMYRTGRFVPLEECPVEISGSGERFTVRRLDNPFEMEIDVAARACTACIGPNLKCFDSLLRVLYSMLLARSDGVLLHSACVRIADSAIVAVGVSGAGKTTFCRTGFPDVLSDELVAIRETATGFRAFATPFWGEGVAGRNSRDVRVDAMYLLRQGPANRVVATSEAAALLEILGCTYFFGPEYLFPQVLDRCGRLAEETMRGLLEFVPTYEVIGFLRAEVECRVG